MSIFGKPIALSTGQRFIHRITLSTFLTTGVKLIAINPLVPGYRTLLSLHAVLACVAGGISGGLELFSRGGDARKSSPRIPISPATQATGSYGEL